MHKNTQPWGHAAKTALSTIGVIPVVGGGIKIVGKMGEVGDLIKGVGKLDDLGDTAKAVGKMSNVNVKEFDIVNYGNKVTGLENHHSILDVWAKHNIPKYVSRASNFPTIALSEIIHSATKKVYRNWLFGKTEKKVGGKIDWTKITPQEIQALSEKMFDAAKVPEYARRNYYSEFYKYLYTVIP